MPKENQPTQLLKYKYLLFSKHRIENSIYSRQLQEIIMYILMFYTLHNQLINYYQVNNCHVSLHHLTMKVSWSDALKSFYDVYNLVHISW